MKIPVSRGRFSQQVALCLGMMAQKEVDRRLDELHEMHLMVWNSDVEPTPLEQPWPFASRLCEVCMENPAVSGSVVHAETIELMRAQVDQYHAARNKAEQTVEKLREKITDQENEVNHWRTQVRRMHALLSKYSAETVELRKESQDSVVSVKKGPVTAALPDADSELDSFTRPSSAPGPFAQSAEAALVNKSRADGKEGINGSKGAAAPDGVCQPVAADQGSRDPADGEESGAARPSAPGADRLAPGAESAGQPASVASEEASMAVTVPVASDEGGAEVTGTEPTDTAEKADADETAALEAEAETPEAEAETETKVAQDGVGSEARAGSGSQPGEPQSAAPAPAPAPALAPAPAEPEQQSGPELRAAAPASGEEDAPDAQRREKGVWVSPPQTIGGLSPTKTVAQAAPLPGPGLAAVGSGGANIRSGAVAEKSPAPPASSTSSAAATPDLPPARPIPLEPAAASRGGGQAQKGGAQQQPTQLRQGNTQPLQKQMSLQPNQQQLLQRQMSLQSSQRQLVQRNATLQPGQQQFLQRQLSLQSSQQQLLQRQGSMQPAMSAFSPPQGAQPWQARPPSRTPRALLTGSSAALPRGLLRQRMCPERGWPAGAGPARLPAEHGGAGARGRRLLAELFGQARPPFGERLLPAVGPAASAPRVRCALRARRCAGAGAREYRECVSI